MPSRPAKKTGGAGPAPTRTVLELAEEAEDRFDEACEHARQQPAHAGLTIGPSLSVPMSRLRAGRLAWVREVRGPKGHAELFYLLDPVPAPRGGRAAELPLLDLTPGRVLADLPLAVGSPLRLLGVGDPKSAPKEFRSFAHAVLAELSSDSE
jgi:hypothetical protein